MLCYDLVGLFGGQHPDIELFDLAISRILADGQGKVSLAIVDQSLLDLVNIHISVLSICNTCPRPKRVWSISICLGPHHGQCLFIVKVTSPWSLLLRKIHQHHCLGFPSIDKKLMILAKCFFYFLPNLRLILFSCLCWPLLAG